MERDPVGKRGADAVAHLGMIAIDGDLAVGRQFDTPQRTIGTGAIVLGHTRNTGTDEHALRRGRFLLRALLPDRMLLELVEDFSGADRNAVGIAGHGPALGRERIAPPELDRIKRQGNRHFVDQRLQRRHRLQRAVTAHRSRGHAARMNGNRGHVDLRHIIDADRGGRADGCHIDREIGQAAAVEDVVRGKSLDLAGRSIDANARTHLEGVALDTALKLLIAVMRQPDGMTGEEHRRQRHIQHERRVIAAAEAAAHIGELGVDPRRLEGSAGLAKQMRDRLRRLVGRLHAQHQFEAAALPVVPGKTGLRFEKHRIDRLRLELAIEHQKIRIFGREFSRGSARHRSRPWRRPPRCPWQRATISEAVSSASVPG